MEESERTKHMRAQLHLVMETLAQKRVTVKYINTSGMIADGLTKTLDGADFDFFTDHVLGANK
jgi:hypothetical protein